MILRSSEALPRLYEEDETAWLEAMSQLVAEGHYDDLDYAHLQEYLADMARRDRREVVSRLSSLIAHRLKWEHQSARRSNSWRGTIEVQRQELVHLLESRTLRNYCGEILDTAYANGIRQAEAETGLPASTFPADCPYSLEALLANNWAASAS